MTKAVLAFYFALDSSRDGRTSLSEGFDDCFDMSIWNIIKSPLTIAEMHVKSGLEFIHKKCSKVRFSEYAHERRH